MKKKKTKKLLIALLTLFLCFVPLHIKVSGENRHYVTNVTPASFTDVIEYYGNTFLLDNGHRALCLERAKDTPQVGTEVTLSYFDNPYIKKILYYGYNGPAEWNGFSCDGEAILCTSIMLSDAYSGYGYKNICDDFKNFLYSAPDVPVYSLNFSPNICNAYGEGAYQRTELITANGDSRISTDITLSPGMELHFSDGSSGTGTVTVHGGDSFYITGSMDSDGTWESGTLHINERAYSMVIAVTSSESIQDLTYLEETPSKECGNFSINWYNKGSLEIIKSSSDESVTKNNTDYSLENATYGLYLSENDAANNQNPIVILATDAYGYARTDNITRGVYYLKELTPPKGYELSPDITTVSVNTLSVTSLSLTDTPVQKPFELTKYGETATDKQPLSGAGFMVCPTSELSKDESGNYIWDYSKTIPITKNGEHELFTNSNGYALTIPLPFGNYLVKETTVPDNYLPVSDFIVKIEQSSGETSNMIYLTDKSFKAYLQIKKQDSTTDKIILNNPATFKIWSFSEEKYVSYTFNEGSRLLTTDRFQTDASGTLITPEPLMPGKYRIEEISSPEGYLPMSSASAYIIDITNTSDYTRYIDENGSYTDMGIFTVCIENTPILGQIKVVKTLQIPEGETTAISLSGISFNIYAGETIYSIDGSNSIIYEAGELVETIVTDENGIALSSSTLPLGIYELEEINCPPGYVKSENIIFDLCADGDSVSIINTTDSKYYLCGQVNIHNNLIPPKVLGATAPALPNTGDKIFISVTIFLGISMILGLFCLKKSH